MSYNVITLRLYYNYICQIFRKKFVDKYIGGPAEASSLLTHGPIYANGVHKLHCWPAANMVSNDTS